MPSHHSPQNVSQTVDESDTPLLANEELRAEVQTHETRNLRVLAAYQVAHRIAWIFKTESVIMPAFMDVIGGPGWLRGCLPVLNRFGQSVPTLIAAEPVRRLAQKKWALGLSAVLMGVPFSLLGWAWLHLAGRTAPWMPYAFLVLYTIFFCAAGMNQMLFGMVQGKLLRPEHRGELMGLSGTIGAVLAIACAWYFLRSWLILPDGGYAYIFGWTGVGFMLAGLFVAGLLEPAERPAADLSTSTDKRKAWRDVLADPNFRRLAVVTVLYSTAQLLFPHYQALGLQRPSAQPTDLMVWVVVQNAGTGVFSYVAGKLSDRFGTRITIQIEAALSAATPLLAASLTIGWQPFGYDCYWLTFVLLGIVPVAYRTLVLHALEIAESSRHAHYLSSLTVCQALPFLLSPLFGGLVDLVGFRPVFVLVAVLVSLAFAMSFRLSEPRHGGSET